MKYEYSLTSETCREQGSFLQFKLVLSKICMDINKPFIIKILDYAFSSCERSKPGTAQQVPRISRSHLTFSKILRIGSTTLLGSTVPQVTLGSKGVNAK
jgi:hypothetical protein